MLHFFFIYIDLCEIQAIEGYNIQNRYNVRVSMIIIVNNNNNKKDNNNSTHD